MSYIVSAKTASKTWEHVCSSVEEAEKYRKFVYGRYRAIGTIKEAGSSSISTTTLPSQAVSDPAKTLLLKADSAGMAAAEKRIPTPMIVCQHENPLDDSSKVIKQYEPVMGGVCGFAWINIKPANSKIAKLAIQHYGAGKDSYEGGVSLFVHQFGQSYEKKVAYANAFTSVLREAGIKASTGNRLD